MGHEQTAPKRRPIGALIAVALATLLSAAGTVVVLSPASTGGSAALAACTANDAETCIPAAALAIAEADGAADGLRAVRVLLETRPELAQGCHDVAHELGKGFRAAFGDDAVVPGNEWCSYGYYHGLMQSAGAEDPAGLVAYAEQLCSRIENTLSADCMHGLGHAAYSTSSSITDAMAVCEGVTGMYARTCADAVIMEDTFTGGTGRMRTPMTPQDCVAFTNVDVRAGCAYGLSGELSRQGLELDGACDAYTERGVYEICTEGYGSSVAGNYLSGNVGGAAEQIASCAANESCSTGFGWISYMYQLDRGKAEQVCREVLGRAGTEACLLSVGKAAEHEKLGR
jgi:hypothetical protein